MCSPGLYLTSFSMSFFTPVEPSKASLPNERLAHDKGGLVSTGPTSRGSCSRCDMQGRSESFARWLQNKTHALNNEIVVNALAGVVGVGITYIKDDEDIIPLLKVRARAGCCFVVRHAHVSNSSGGLLGQLCILMLLPAAYWQAATAYTRTCRHHYPLPEGAAQMRLLRVLEHSISCLTHAVPCVVREHFYPSC